MLSFAIVNLLIPGSPKEFNVRTPSGVWYFKRADNFEDIERAILNNGQCANSYYVRADVSRDSSFDEKDRYFDEITPILLGSSYLTGLSVTIKNSLPTSEIMIIQPTSHWPRERAMCNPSYCFDNYNDFINLLETFIGSWEKKAQEEKLLLLIHHWLDALSCWSIEDLYLSSTTLLQIIVATEKKKQNKKKLTFYDGIKSASQRFSIKMLSRDFLNMRNDLIHEGTISGSTFENKTITDCSRTVAGVLNWFDHYLHAVLALGNIHKKRFSDYDFISLNSFSLKEDEDE